MCYIEQMDFLILQMECEPLSAYWIQQPRKSNMKLYKRAKENNKLIKIKWMYAFQFLVLDLWISEPHISLQLIVYKFY